MTDDHSCEPPGDDLARPMSHPDAAAMRLLGEQVLDWLLHDFQSLPDRPVGGRSPRSRLEALLREPAPETGTDFSAVLEAFQDKVCPNAVRVDHPRFLAF